ncbi:MAG TPA: LysR substrate-binding domain-containing protein [Stellaceae bacterium]|nr:LysR substrate-binding domain-containing protein [Stellaceae bacterium]
MLLAGISFRDLEYVVAVAEHQHFGRAAQACTVSQPTLSGQIRKLEDYLQVEIFERGSRQVRPTRRGAEIVAQARTVLAEGRRLCALAARTDAPLTGALRLGAIATLGPYLFPHLLRPLTAAFPQLRLVISEGLTRELTALLLAGRIDALLAATPVAGAGIAQIPLFFEPFVVTLPADHALCDTDTLTPGHLAGDDLILLQDGHCLRDQALEICPDPARTAAAAELQASSIETLRHMIASGIGYSLLPTLSVTDDPRFAALLTYRRFAADPPGRTIALFYRDGSERHADMRLLAAQIRKSLPGSVQALDGGG